MGEYLPNNSANTEQKNHIAVDPNQNNLLTQCIDGTKEFISSPQFMIGFAVTALIGIIINQYKSNLIKQSEAVADKIDTSLSIKDGQYMKYLESGTEKDGRYIYYFHRSISENSSFTKIIESELILLDQKYTPPASFYR
jgi:hypothetical protein